MKRISLKFFTMFISTLLLTIPVFQFYSPPKTNALVSSGYWSERTPKTGNGFSSDSEFQYFGYYGTYYSAHTPFAELIETKPSSQGGGKVIHWFLGIPNCGDWGYGGSQTPIIFHSSNQGSTWTRITPTGLGGRQMNFLVVPEPWHTNNDPTQSRWNGKLLLYADKNDNRVDVYYGSYFQYRPALYRYDGDGTSSSWTNLISENLSGFNDLYSLGSAYYHMYGVYGKTFQSYLTYYKGKVYLVSWRLNQSGWPCYWTLNVHAYDGTTSSLINSPGALNWTRKWESSVQYENYPYMGPCHVLFFEEVDDYLFLGTGRFTNASPYSLDTENGVLWQSDANGQNFAHNLPAPQAGVILSELRPAYTDYRYPANFDLSIGGTTYTAYVYLQSGWDPGPGDTVIYDPWGGTYFGYYFYWYSSSGYDVYWDYYIRDLYGWYGYYGNCVFTYSSIDHNTREVWLTMIQPASGGAPQPVTVPLTLIEYKGYAYAGFSHNSGNVTGSYASGKIRRTNRFTDNLGNPNTFVDAGGVPQGGAFANWTDCGDVQDPSYPQWDRRLRDKNAAVTVLSKSQKPRVGGGFDDDLLYIGSSSQSYFSGYGVNCLFTTEGLNAGGVDALPLKYTLYEDEWNYDRLNPARHYKGTYPDSMFSVYNIKTSSVGLLVFFTTVASKQPEGFGQRYFHILNAAPSLRIDHNPKPFVIERGQSADLIFELTPSGGFGQAGFRMQLIFDSPNMYLPANPYLENQKFSTRLTQQGPLQFFDNIPWEVTPTVRTTLSQPLGLVDAKLIVTDQLLGLAVEYNFRVTVRPPQPGFSASVLPSNQRIYAGQTVCFDVNIETRFDFEDNVIVGIFWSSPPPVNDTNFEWKDSTYIFDRLDQTMVEVLTRKNMGTQYQFCLKTEKTVTPGNYEFQLMFFSSVPTRTTKVKITILPPQPTFKIDTMPIIGKAVPGGVVQYLVTIQSIDNYVGPVSLHIENLPSSVQLVRLDPVTVNLTLTQPVAYADLVLQTFSSIYSPDKPTNFFSKVISSSVINLSWIPSYKGTYDIAGYEIYRGPNEYIEKAVKIAQVGPNVVNYDDAQGIERGTTYVYFIRAFDNQTPPNYSEFVASNDAKPMHSPSITPQAIVANTGTLPGYYRFIVVGDGVGTDEYGQQYLFTVPADTDLLVYKQIDQMKTPAFDTWGLLALMLGLFVFMFVQKRKRESLES